MQAEIVALDDVTREITLKFQEGSKVFVQLHVDEQIEGVGDVSYEKSLRDVFYIKIGLASDAIDNDNKEKMQVEGALVEGTQQEERATWAGVRSAAARTR